jgi:hypothetical protein
MDIHRRDDGSSKGRRTTAYGSGRKKERRELKVRAYVRVCSVYIVKQSCKRHTCESCVNVCFCHMKQCFVCFIYVYVCHVRKTQSFHAFKSKLYVYACIALMHSCHDHARANSSLHLIILVYMRKYQKAVCACKLFDMDRLGLNSQAAFDNDCVSAQSSDIDCVRVQSSDIDCVRVQSSDIDCVRVQSFGNAAVEGGRDATSTERVDTYEAKGMSNATYTNMCGPCRLHDVCMHTYKYPCTHTYANTQTRTSQTSIDTSVYKLFSALNTRRNTS